MEQANDTAERVLNWLDGYLKALIAISVFGGQITFTVIVSEIADPAALSPTSTDAETKSFFGIETVRIFVALSWLFFMVELGIAALVKILLMDEYMKGATRTYFARRKKSFLYIYSGLTFLLNGLPLVAFLFLALAVAAYVPVVGWIGVGLISLFTLAVFVLWAKLDA
jgi:hypothetical protein